MSISQNPNNLPSNWNRIALKELIQYALGGDWGKNFADTIPEGFVTVKIIRGTEFKNWLREKGKTSVIRLIKKDSLMKRQLRENDIVIEISGGGPTQPVGRTVLIDKEVIENSEYPLVCSNFFRQIRLYLCLSSQFVNSYLNFAYRLGEFDDFQTQTTNLRNLNFNDFISKTIIPLPPLNEQRRIVAKIEALKGKSERVKGAIAQIPQLLDQFRQSVLAAAFRGDLTADWREQNPDVEPAEVLLMRTAKQLNKNFDESIKKINNQGRQFIPDNWVWTSLDLFIKNIQSGKNFTCPEIPVSENTVGLVKISAVTWGKFDEKETKTVIDNSKIDPKLFIKKGDFLISRANTLELVGASVIVDEVNYPIMISDKVWRVNFLEVNSSYINLYLKSKKGRKEIENRATGNQLSMRNISQSAFRDVVIALPSLEEQKEIVRQIQSFFTTIDTIQEKYQKIKTQIDQLDQSILAKAFRGELVPQNPNDEPASVLLERIRAEREKISKLQPKKSKTKKSTSKSKARTQKTQPQESTQLKLDLE